MLEEATRCSEYDLVSRYEEVNFNFQLDLCFQLSWLEPTDEDFCLLDMLRGMNQNQSQ